MIINLSDYTKFVVIGFYYNSTKKFRHEYKAEVDGASAFMINLWRGNVYGYRKSDGKRVKLKSVYN